MSNRYKEYFDSITPDESLKNDTIRKMNEIMLDDEKTKKINIMPFAAVAACAAVTAGVLLLTPDIGTNPSDSRPTIENVTTSEENSEIQSEETSVYTTSETAADSESITAVSEISSEQAAENSSTSGITSSAQAENSTAQQTATQNAPASSVSSAVQESKPSPSEKPVNSVKPSETESAETRPTATDKPVTLPASTDKDEPAAPEATIHQTEHASPVQTPPPTRPPTVSPTMNPTMSPTVTPGAEPSRAPTSAGVPDYAPDHGNNGSDGTAETPSGSTGATSPGGSGVTYEYSNGYEIVINNGYYSYYEPYNVNTLTPDEANEEFGKTVVSDRIFSWYDFQRITVSANSSSYTKSGVIYTFGSDSAYGKQMTVCAAGIGYSDYYIIRSDTKKYTYINNNEYLFMADTYSGNLYQCLFCKNGIYYSILFRDFSLSEIITVIENI